jgi:pimeloyl-ACP methyl ester carboxylesterase
MFFQDAVYSIMRREKHYRSLIDKIVLTGLLILLISSNPAPKKHKMESIPIYKEGFIDADKLKFHYLDWGGSGPPLILLHGLGDSPYIFEGIAESLQNNFRIIACSKRWHGKSEAVDSIFDMETLAGDLKILLDSMSIEKANLLGWSMGGSEITEFAIRYPERTDKLIYLEAGYDLSDEAFRTILKNIPVSPFPDKVDLYSLDAYRSWYHKFWFGDIEWNHILESNLVASTSINSDGSVMTRPNDRISKSFLESIMSYHRDYKKIQAPALAIFTNTFFYPPNDEKVTIDFYDTLEKNVIDPWRQHSINRIKSELRNVQVKFMPAGTHVSFIFLSKDSLIESINSFLLQD